jgi:hypothetical protein
LAKAQSSHQNDLGDLTVIEMNNFPKRPEKNDGIYLKVDSKQDIVHKELKKISEPIWSGGFVRLGFMSLEDEYFAVEAEIADHESF